MLLKCKHMHLGLATANSYYMSSERHPAGNVTSVSVMPRTVTVKIGDDENRCRG